MINFEEELKKYNPLPIKENEEVLKVDGNLADITDILEKILSNK